MYGTKDCHLCELAQELVDSVRRPGADPVVEVVDIADSDDLFERYGLRIPVLLHPDGRELNWPFTAVELTEFFNIGA